MEYKKVKWVTEEVMVTPDKAREILATSLGNRGISDRAVHRYARDMKLGHWDCAGDGSWITMYDGHLMDANHRMYAVIESGETIPMMIRIPDRKPKCFDLNKVRSAKDILDMNEGVNGHLADSKIITIARFIWENIFHIKYSGRATEFDIKDYYEDHDDVLTDARRLHEYCIKGAKALLRNGHCGAAIYAALRYGVPYETLNRFCQIVVTGLYEGKKETSAVALRNLILSYDNTRTKGEGGMAYRKMLCFVTQRAISDFVKGVERIRPYKVTDTETCYTDFIREQDESSYVISETVVGENKTENKKRDKKKDSMDILLQIFSINTDAISPDVKEAVVRWIEYKSERKDFYTETGIKTLVNKAVSTAKVKGDRCVVNMIDTAITNNWKGWYFAK